ncbi:MAG: metallophosphoesterase [Bdellovibrionales bacterium]|nr:metallophosphoesterase [Bdellovibrionales bacterium]
MTLVSNKNFLSAGAEFDKPKFLVLAGDITESADSNGCDEWSQFEYHFPAGGIPGYLDRLSYPTTETTGNHDFPFMPTLKQARDIKERKKISTRIQLRHRDRELGLDNAHGNRVNLIAQTSDRGAYTWEFQGIHFFNLNTKPSGGGHDVNGQDLTCGKRTNKAHITSDGSAPSPSNLIRDDDCWEYVIRKKKYRVVDPQKALTFLENKGIENSQIVVTTHYGPMSQSRIANDELRNFCTILKKKRIRVIAWLVGHTHRSDYYEWQCGGYNVPVFNVGSGFQLATNKDQIHFSTFRVTDNWLEALDISFDPTSNVFHVPGVQANNAINCTNAKGNLRYPNKRNIAVPYNIIKNGIYDSFDHAGNPGVAQWCNPDGKWGGWQVRVPICPPGISPYLGASGLNINPACL